MTASVASVDGLRPLTPGEAEMVAAWPLPDGVPDALLNRYQLRDALGKSLTTLDAWRQAGMPVEEAGTNGRQYQFRLALCFAWMRAREDEDSARRQKADDAAAQMRLALTGGGPGASERAQLTPRQQRELLEAESAWMVAARRRGELIPVDESRLGLEAAFAAIRDAADALPDRAGRELGLDGTAVETLQRYCDEFLRDAAARISELVGAGDGGGDDGGGDGRGGSGLDL